MSTTLQEKYDRIIVQANDIDEKQKQVLTRSRMLQIAQERNIFARKLFYTLVALILFIMVLTLFIYSYKSGSGSTKSVSNNFKRNNLL